MTALINLVFYTNQHTHLGLTYYYDVTKYLVYQLLQDNSITLSKHVFTFCDSNWDDDHDTSRSTEGLLIF
jgi:hypothetical protein